MRSEESVATHEYLTQVVRILFLSVVTRQSKKVGLDTHSCNRTSRASSQFVQLVVTSVSQNCTIIHTIVMRCNQTQLFHLDIEGPILSRLTST